MVTAASVGVKPDEFWEMTLREFDCVMQGQAKRVRINLEMMAWHAANIMNCWTKAGSKVSVRKLLGDEKKELSPTELAAELSAKAKKNERPDISETMVEGTADVMRAYDEEMGYWARRVTEMAIPDDLPPAVRGGGTLGEEEENQ